MATITDFALISTGVGSQATIPPPQWFRLHNNETAIDYYTISKSDAASGAFSYSNVPPDDYTLYSGPTPTVVGTPTLISSHYRVPYTAGDDMVMHSGTAKSASPNTQNAGSGVLNALRAMGGHPRTIVALGDSITVRNTASGTFPLAAGSNMGCGYLQMGCAAIGQKLRFAGNFGQGGQTSTFMLANYLPTILALNPLPGWCVIESMGANDYPAAIPVATSQANHVSMANQLKAAGIQPIMAAQTPQNAASAPQLLYQRQLTAFMRRFAEANGLQFLDFYAALVDPASATDNYLAGYNDDNTHPNPVGYWAMAQEFRKLDLTPYATPLSWATADSLNLLTNGTFAGAGPIATGWTLNSAGAGYTDSTVSGDPGIAGQWQHVVSTANSFHRIIQDVHGGSGGSAVWSDGDILALNGVFRTSGTSGGGYPKISIALTATQGGGGGVFAAVGDSGTGSTAAARAWLVDMDRATFYIEFAVPAGAQWARVLLDHTSGAGVASFAQLALVNLTTNQLLPAQVTVI